MNKNKLLTEEEFNNGIKECIDKVKNEMAREEFEKLLEANGIAFVGEAAWRVVQLVAAHEREACENIIEDIAKLNDYVLKDKVIDAIRARVKK